MTPGERNGHLLAELYPRLFHVTDFGNAEGIRRHGLRSTARLLEAYEVDETVRVEALHGTRQRSIPITHDRQGRASIRDQLPLSVGRLRGALTDMSVDEWLERLNSLVFFWPTLARLERLLRAPVYADRDHHVLTLDTAALVANHGPDILLAPINTGATRPFAHPRGRNTFQALGEFPLQERRRRIGRANAVAEVTVRGAVPDIDGMLLSVERWHGPSPVETTWERPV